MATDPAYAIQVAMAAALLAASSVTDLVGDAVYDDLAAPASVYPRICIGDDQVIGEVNTCFETSETYSTVHIWCCGAGGRLQAKQIAAVVRDVLNRPLTLTGHMMTSAIFHDARHLTQGDDTDPDALIAHSVLTFHFHTIPAIS